MGGADDRERRGIRGSGLPPRDAAIRDLRLVVHRRHDREHAARARLVPAAYSGSKSGGAKSVLERRPATTGTVALSAYQQEEHPAVASFERGGMASGLRRIGRRTAPGWRRRIGRRTAP